MQEKRKQRIGNFIVSMVFLTFLGFFGIAYIVVPDRDYSELENRYLVTFPDFTWKRLWSGEFMSDFDSYTADQIYGKDWFVQGQVDYDRLLGMKEINQVFLGNDDYMIQDYQEPDSVLTENIGCIEYFALKHPEIPMTVLVAPNVNEIYPEKLPKFAETYPQTEVMETLQETLSADNLQVVDVTECLQQQKEEQIYYRTDHHWTSLGAYYAYRELCTTLGLTAHSLEDYSVVTLEDPFYGSLYSKAPVSNVEGDSFELLVNPQGNYRVTYVNEDRITDTMYDESYFHKKDKYASFFGGNYALVTIENDKADTGDVLILKDSYANALVPYLADHYSRIHMIDLRYYHDDVDKYIKDHDIKQVIFIHNVDFLSTDNCFVWL